MSIEEIISELERLVQKPRGQNASLTDGWPLDSQLLADETVLREAIALLKTHPEAQANEPLTPEELREMGGRPYWHVGLQDDSPFNTENVCPVFWAIVDMENEKIKEETL